MELKTINSSLITWTVMQGDKYDDFIVSYCADGDGLLQLVEFTDRFELVDQLEVCKVWLKSSNPDLSTMLECAQSYLAATYHEIYELAMHWENPLTKEDYSSAMGYNFKD